MERRPKPYVWVTWVTGLLAGTDRCQYRPWVKAQFQLPKKSQTKEDKERLDGYLKIHDEMTAKRATILRAEGKTVRIEDENSFKLEGGSAILSGKPDLISIEPDKMEALIVDEKSGKEKEQYIWQVILYMFAMSLTHLKGYKIRGEVEYKNKIVPVRPEQLSLANVDRIKTVMQIMGKEEAPPTVPSAAECQYCDVLGCPDRFKIETDASHYF